MLPSQFTHKRTLANRREAYEAYTGNTSPGNIEASCPISTCILTPIYGKLTPSTTSTRRWCQQLSFELRQLSFELA